MSLRTNRWSYARACLLLVAFLPVIGGGECARVVGHDYSGPGDVFPGMDCAIPGDPVDQVFSRVGPTDPVCTDNEAGRVTPCGCEDYSRSVPAGAFIPSRLNPLGCHQDVAGLGLKYMLPGCAQIAELSGHVMHSVPYNNNPEVDNDANVDLCPDVPTMRVDPFADGTTMELRSLGTFFRDPHGAIHIEIQDCRWYDGLYTMDAKALNPELLGNRIFSSRPEIPAKHEMFSAAGDWVADFNHAGDLESDAHTEIHEARAVALVKPVTGTIAVALTNAFFTDGTHQQHHIHLGIKMPGAPLPDPDDPNPTEKHWTLNCRVLQDGFSVDPPCQTKSGVDFDAKRDDEGRCNLELDNDNAITPMQYQCTDTCFDKRYSDLPNLFCNSIHFMNPVVGEWVDPADLWMCQCSCDDPSAPGAIIAAPVQGCAQINLDPSKPEDQQIACAQVCGGQICGAAPACRIGECHAPGSGGTAQLIARGVCDPAKPQPTTRVSAAGDYHVTIDRNASSFEVNFDTLSATSTLDGTLHFNLNESDGVRLVDIADSRLFPDDFSLSIASVTNATVVSSNRALGQFGIGTTFQIPANSSSFGAEALIAEKSEGGEVLMPDDMTGTINNQTREFTMDFFAEAPPESSDVDEEESGRDIIAHIVGTIDNIPPVAVSGGPTRTVECSSPTLTPVTLNGLSSFDPDPGDSISHYQWFTAAGAGAGNHAVVSTALPVGHSEFVLHVYDDDLGSAAAPLDINVVDSTAPTLTLSPQSACMWPPDHKRIRFRIGTDVNATATDACDSAPSVRIVNVTSTQPDDLFGDGNSIHDVSFSDHAFCIRRERTPLLGERIYRVTIEARDASGNITTTILPIRVAPNNSGNSCPSIGTVIAEDAPCE